MGIDQLLHGEGTLIRRLCEQLDTAPEAFDRLVRPAVELYVGFVHLLPASCADHHSGPGGRATIDGPSTGRLQPVNAAENEPLSLAVSLITRYNLRKAKRQGLRCRTAPTASMLKDF